MVTYEDKSDEGDEGDDQAEPASTPVEKSYAIKPEMREQLGKRVREAWISWAEKQPNPKPSWLVPWDQMGEADREADRVIGEALFDELDLSRELDEVRDEYERHIAALRARQEEAEQGWRVQVRALTDSSAAWNDKAQVWKERALKPRSERTAWSLFLLLLATLGMLAWVRDRIPEPVVCPPPVECPTCEVAAPVEPASPVDPTIADRSEGYWIYDGVGGRHLVPWPDTTGYPAERFNDDCAAVCSAPASSVRGTEPGRVLVTDPAHLVCICFHDDPTVFGPVTRYINWDRQP